MSRPPIRRCAIPPGSATCREHGTCRRWMVRAPSAATVWLTSNSPHGAAASAAPLASCAIARWPRWRSPISTATRSTPRSRSATIRSWPTSPSSSAAASAAWSRRPATSRARLACARRCRCSRRWRSAPQAVVIRPDMAKYVRVGREVRQAMQALTPLVEPLSIDEAFLDLSGTQRVHGMIPAKVLARFARDVERDIGITVSVGLSVQQVPRQDRLRPRQAPRLCRARPGRGARDAGRAAGRLHLWRRPRLAGKAGAARLSPHRRPAARRRARTDEAVRRRRPAAVAAGARHRRPQRGAGSRRQEHFQRDHVRERHPRFRDAGETALEAVGKSLGAAEEQRPRRQHHHAEAEDRRFSPAHPLAIDPVADAAGGEDLCASRAKCW